MVVQVALETHRVLALAMEPMVEQLPLVLSLLPQVDLVEKEVLTKAETLLVTMAVVMAEEMEMVAVVQQYQTQHFLLPVILLAAVVVGTVVLAPQALKVAVVLVLEQVVLVVVL
jgi:hypothetical protein